MHEKARILDEEKLKRTVSRIGHEIAERNSDLDDVVLVGIKTRGVTFAKRLQSAIKEFENVELLLGELDITLYRDDLSELAEMPEVKKAELPFDVKGKTVVLCDDVIFTGRTVRAAIDALFSCGRPKAVQLAVLVDRGHREIPFKPDFVGKNIPTALSENVAVRFTDTDGEEAIVILENN